jgi:hypothetical protein
MEKIELTDLAEQAGVTYKEFEKVIDVYKNGETIAVFTQKHAEDRRYQLEAFLTGRISLQEDNDE